MATLFSNATLLPMTASADDMQTFTGSLGVEGDRIAFISAAEADAAAFQGRPIPDCAKSTPRTARHAGLINTHCHAAASLQRSLADDIPLMKWLNEHIWPFEARQTPEDVALGMELGIVEMLLGGITSFVDMYYHQNRCVSVAERLGIRAVLGCNYFDSNIDEVFTELEEAADRAASCDRVRIAVAPHSPYTVSTKNPHTRTPRGRTGSTCCFMTHIAGDAGRNTHHPRAVRCDARRIPRPAGSARAEDHRRTLRARYSGGYRHDSRAGHDRFAQPAEQHGRYRVG